MNQSTLARASIVGCVMLVGAGFALGQAEPPAQVNYQGVLRDAAGDAESGDFDMVFRFYDTDGGAPPCPAAGGTLLLTDSHLAAGTGAVTVTGGLFNVALGGGSLTAGSEATFAEVFRDNAAVYLELQVSGEILCPRVRVISAAYALNSDHLDGRNSTFVLDRANHTGTQAPATISPQGAGSGLDADLLDGNDAGAFLDESATAETKLGDLTVANLHVSGTRVDWTAAGFGGSAFAAPTGLTLVAGDVDSDDLALLGGNGADGQVVINGGGNIVLQSGGAAGDFVFANGAGTTVSVLDQSGNLQTDGDVTASGGAVFLDIVNAGPRLFFDPALLSVNLWAGGISTDDVVLQAGATLGGADGRLFIAGDEFMELTAGNGNFRFRNGATSVQTADLSSTGDLQLDGDVTVSGGDLVVPLTFRIMPPAAGDVNIGDNVAPGEGQDVQIGDGGLCVDGDGMCAAPVDGHIKALVYDVAGPSDIAEVFPSSEALQPGDVVVLDRGEDGKVRKATAPYEEGMMSVVSTAPGFILGAPTDEDLATHGLEAEQGPNFGNLLLVPGTYPIAFMGRVPVRVSDENGPVDRGDMLTSSSLPGVAMRATQTGSVLGHALQGWPGPGIGTINALVMPGRHTVSTATPGASTSTETAQTRGVATGEAAGPTVSVPGSQGPAAAGHASFRLDDQGNLYARSFRPTSGDLADFHPVSEALEAGDVVVMDPGQVGKMRRGSRAADPAVVGIAVGEPGFALGSGVAALTSADPDLARQLEEARVAENREAELTIWKQLERKFQEARAPVAVSGIVSCKVDAGYGAIRLGDLLTTSPTAGHAMLAAAPVPGTVLGKALEPLDAGTGLIRVLVMLR